MICMGYRVFCNLNVELDILSFILHILEHGIISSIELIPIDIYRSA